MLKEYELTDIQLEEGAFKSYMVKAEHSAKNKVMPNKAMLNIALAGIGERFYDDDVVRKWAYRSFFAMNIYV